MLYTRTEPDDAETILHVRFEPGAPSAPGRLCLVPAVRPEAVNPECRNAMVDLLRRVGVGFEATQNNLTSSGVPE